MKILKMSLVMLLMTIATHAQDIRKEDVPQPVLKKFNQTYPSVNYSEWERNGDQFKVEINRDNDDLEIWYDQNGKELKTEREIPVSKLPSLINNKLKRDYPDYRIDDIEEKKYQNKTEYRVSVESNSGEMTIDFDSKGTVLKTYHDD